MAEIVALKSETPDAPLDVLHGRRAELMNEAARLNKVAEARAATERRLQELDAEQTAIDEAERVAWREWVERRR